MSTNNNIFTKLSRIEIIAVLEEALLYKRDLLLWSKGDEQREKFRLVDFDKEQMLLTLQPILPTTTLKNKEVLINFKLKKLQYFSSATLLYNSDTDQFYLTVNKTFFKCDKRQNIRIPASDLNGVNILINHKMYIGYDLSAGGASIIFPENTQLPFKQEDIIDELTILFNGNRLTTKEIRVTHLIPLKDHLHDITNTKIGLEFLRPSAEFEATIFREINDAIYKKLNPLG